MYFAVVHCVALGLFVTFVDDLIEAIASIFKRNNP